MKYYTAIQKNEEFFVKNNLQDIVKKHNAEPHVLDYHSCKNGGNEDCIYISTYCLCMHKKSLKVFREASQVTGNKRRRETFHYVPFCNLKKTFF